MTGPSASELAGENPFWTFCLTVYRKPGVEEALLSLQNDDGADVLTILFCGWLAGASLPDSERAKLIADGWRIADPWQRELVQPIRAARAAMKAKVEKDARDTAVQADLSDIRKTVKATELALEALLTRRLAALVPDDTVFSARASGSVVSALGQYAAASQLSVDVQRDARVAAVLAAMTEAG